MAWGNSAEVFYDVYDRKVARYAKNSRREIVREALYVVARVRISRELHADAIAFNETTVDSLARIYWQAALL